MPHGCPGTLHMMSPKSDLKGDWNQPIGEAMYDELIAPSTTQSNSSGDQLNAGSHRKERGAIAAQACDTCRSRKQRCDEQRPKCGTCQKFRLECNYREPQPTKKDRTLLEILDRIKSLESKVDRLDIRASSVSENGHAYAVRVHGSSIPAPVSSVMSPGSTEPMSTSFFHTADARWKDSRSTTATGRDDSYVYASSTAQMMAWPAMRRILDPIKDRVPGFNPATIEQDGPRIILGLHEHYQRPPLSADATQGQLRPVGPMTMQTPAGSPVTLETLTWETMQRLSKAFFDSVNFLFPLVDREAFNSHVMPSLVRDGFNESMTSTVALLVFALGELAIGGLEGTPIHTYNGRQSGLRGGTSKAPPGLALFNEARKRIGFNLTECSIENVQVYALAGIYYGTTCHNAEQWRMTTCASMAIQALVASKPQELCGPRADLIRRAFWYCCMMETCIILEIGMPTTGLEKMEQIVGLPDFSESLAEEDYAGNQSTHFQEHFATQIVLRRLMMDFHIAMGQDPSRIASPQLSGSPSTQSGASPSSNSGPQSTDTATLKLHASQLSQWGDMLPVPLRWQEDQPGAFPAQNPSPDLYHAAGFPLPPVTTSSINHPSPFPLPGRQENHQHSNSHSASTAHGASPPLMFTTDLDAPPTPYPFAFDIQVALIRTRYYYAKYLFHRPYLYKALHSPDTLTADDARCVGICLGAALKWPVTLSPACKHKRMEPCLYYWTQSVLGVLLVLCVVRTDPMLQRIVREGLCGENWEVDAAETVRLYIDWLRDLSEMDPTAKFGLRVALAVYGLDEVPMA